MDVIPQIQPWIDHEELIQLERVTRSTYLVENAMTLEFEDLTLKLTGAKFAVAYSNGTTALYACLKALDIGPGDEVIVPNFTFIATANAVIMAGAKPIFCEVTIDTFCIDLSHAQKLVTPRTKAIIPVHLYGQSADMDEVMDFARVAGIKVIEDAAQGVGVQFRDRHVGTWGDLGVLSYYGNKTITCGEGGMILTNDATLKQKCYRLKNHGRDSKGTFIHKDIGFNFSFTEMQAAVGIAQMHKLSRIIEKKRLIRDRYVSALDHIKKIQPTVVSKETRPVFWFSSFLADDRDALADSLDKAGIQTRRFFYPLHLQPCYQDLVPKNRSFDVSVSIYERGISLPSSYSLTSDQQNRVITEIRRHYAG